MAFASFSLTANPILKSTGRNRSEMRTPRSVTRSPRRTVRLARNPNDLAVARRLFREYRQWHVDHRDTNGVGAAELRVGFGYLDAEIAALPGEYAPPRGALLLAFDEGTPIGCGALRPLGPRLAEIKRVYVRPRARGGGVGRRIVRRLLTEARRLGYERVVLDTLPTMTAAITLYRTMGFASTRPYWEHPVARALFFEYRLGRKGARRA